MPTAPTIVWLTPKAHKAMTNELAKIKRIDIPAVELALSEANSDGKLIDNGSLDAALFERAMLIRRCNILEDKLSNCVVRESGHVTSHAGVGMLVALQDADGDETEYLFSEPENKASGVSTLSPHSPLGILLLGKKVGSIISYKAPSGTLSVTLVSVTSPE